MLYLDTSSLLKTLIAEPESSAVDSALAVERAIVITPLVELESLVQIRARWLGGRITNRQYRTLQDDFEALKDATNMTFRTLKGTVFTTAIRQHREAGEIHCRSLDRLHLAAMEELGITRLMTHDSRQADAARAAGFRVLTPGTTSEAAG